MVLKRQTVWLLTMLSLIIVLSVYYISMDGINDRGALGDIEEDNEPGELSDNEDFDFDSLDEDEVTFIELTDIQDVMGDDFFSNPSSVADVFDTIRLQREDSRSRLREDYMAVFDSTEASTVIKSQAFDKHENLYTLQQKEESLETLIKSKGYEDALVIAEEEGLKIYVKADDLSKEETVEIMMLSYDHLGIENIRVGFQSDN